MRYLYILLLFTCGIIVDAIPTQLGPTGAVTLPGAECLTGFVTAADIIDNTNQRGRLLRVNYGTGDAEVGLLYGADDGSTSGVNGKLRLTPHNAEFPAAVGIAYREYPYFNERVIYAAVEHQFISDVKATVGVQHAQIHAITGNVTGTRGYLAVTVRMPRNEEVCGEIQTFGDSLYESRAIASVRYTKHYRLYDYSIGTTNANGILGGDRQNLFAGMSVAWR